MGLARGCFIERPPNCEFSRAEVFSKALGAPYAHFEYTFSPPLRTSAAQCAITHLFHGLLLIKREQNLRRLNAKFGSFSPPSLLKVCDYRGGCSCGRENMPCMTIISDLLGSVCAESRDGHTSMGSVGFFGDNAFHRLKKTCTHTRGSEKSLHTWRFEDCRQLHRKRVYEDTFAL